MVSVLLIFGYFGLTILAGCLLFNPRKRHFELSLLPLYFSIGICLLSFLSLVFRLHGKLGTIVIGVALFLVLALLLIKKMKVIFLKKEVGYLIGGFVFAIILAIYTFGEGYQPSGALTFLSEQQHDALWHIGLQESIKKSIPPHNQIYDGTILKGYHYLFDLYLANFSSFTGISTVTTYLRFAPILLGFLLISSSFLLFRTIFKKVSLAFLATIYFIFCCGFSYLAPFLFPGASNNQSVFWLDQPLKYLINQQLTFSIIVINCIFYILITESRKKLLMGFLIGVLAGIKIYGFLILIIGLLITSLITLFKNRNLELIKTIIWGSLIGLLVISLVGGGESGFPFILKPGWFIQTMFSTSDRLNTPIFDIPNLIPFSLSAIHYYILFWIFGLSVFFIGNLGLKFLLFIYILFLFGLSIVFPFKKKKSFFSQHIRTSLNILNDQFYLLLFIICSFCFLIPHLFIQKGINWNSIQFLHYSQLPLVLLLLKFLQTTISMQKLKLILTSLILIGLPTTISVYQNYLNPKTFFSYKPEVLEAMNVLKNVDDSKKIILNSFYNVDSMVPALAGKAVFLADPIILGILNINYDNRQEFTNKLETGQILCQPGEVYLTHITLDIASNSGKQLFVTSDGMQVMECLSLKH